MSVDRNIIVLSEVFPGFAARAAARLERDRVDEIEETYSLLWFLSDISVSRAEVRDWTRSQRREAANWATAVHLSAAGLETGGPCRRPAFLGAQAGAGSGAAARWQEGR